MSAKQRKWIKFHWRASIDSTRINQVREYDAFTSASDWLASRLNECVESDSQVLRASIKFIREKF